MQLNNSSIQSFLETVGYLRFSAFYSPQYASQGAIVQKVARAAVSGFVILSLYDFTSNALPFKAKVIVHGTLALVITCLGLSLLFKRLQKTSIHPERPKTSYASPFVLVRRFLFVRMDQSPFANVRRRLFSDFE